MTQSTTLSAPLRLLVRLPLWQQILIGLALGVAAGMAFGADGSCWHRSARCFSMRSRCSSCRWCSFRWWPA